MDLKEISNANNDNMQYAQKLIDSYDKLKVSTMTYIANTNILIRDSKKLFDSLPITNYEIKEKKRGRKKKTIDPVIENNLSPGDIVFLEYETHKKGVQVKKKREKSKKFFRNSITVVMAVEDESRIDVLAHALSKPECKLVNIKISKNGSLQITGCRSVSQVENSVLYLWNEMKDMTDIYDFAPDTSHELTITFIPAMRNIDFQLNFFVDREKFDDFFNNETRFESLLDTSAGYAGINIKAPFDKPITELQLKILTVKENELETTYKTYQTYLDGLKVKDRNIKNKKKRSHTFLIFQSGQVILTSLNAEYAKPVFEEFVRLVFENKDRLVEQLDDDASSNTDDY